MQLLANHPFLFFLISLVFMTLGAWLGATVLRRNKALDDAAREDFGVVQNATLTLLALVLGFSLSMAVGRYDQRKNYEEEEEANAIGTEYLRVDLLSARTAAQLCTLLPYPARITLPTSRINVDNKWLNLTPGMAVTVEVKTGRRRVAEYFLSPLIEYASESLRER